MPVTIRDVARRLGLSITTVSRALDGYPDVAEETRQIVIRTAQEMGYAPNWAARHLRRRHTDAIGYVLPADSPRFTDPFFAEFIAGLGDEAVLHGYDLLVSTAKPGGEDEERLYQRWIQEQRVDGFVLNRIQLYDWRVSFLQQAGFPYASLEYSLDAIDPVCVEVDNQGGIVALMVHLYNLGHRRIAYIGGPQQLKIQRERYSGYEQSLISCGIPLDPQLVATSNLTQSGGYSTARQILALDQPPTAIICINDITAIGVLHAAHDLGLQVGQDLAVAGFDGIEQAEHTHPPLTTLNQPVYTIARNLVAMLVMLISGQVLEQRLVKIEPELIIRASTEGRAFSHPAM